MKVLPYIVIIVLAGMIIFNGREVDIKEIHTTDTVFINRIDTIFQKSIVEKEVKVVDTMYIQTENGTVELPKESKHYSKEGIYDAWVSGYNPSLDSIMVYQKTKTMTITNDNIRYAPCNKWNIYAEGGFSSICGTLSPQLGISITSPKRLKFGAEIGLHKNSITYGVNLGIKLNR